MEENQVQEVVQEATQVMETTTQEQPQTQKKERDNLVAMRLKLEAEEAARREAERKAEEAMRYAEELKRAANPQLAQSEPADQEDEAIDPDDYLQGKTFQKTTKKIKNKQQEQASRLAQLEEKLAYMETKAELSTIKDFYEVVTEDNIKNFARLYPEDYNTALSNPNPVAKTKTLYNMIKNYGVAQPMSNSQVEKKIEQNKQKPVSASLAGAQTSQTPLSRLNEYDRRVLTEADRDRILAEVQRKKMMY